MLLLLLCCWLLTGPQLLLQLGAWTWMVASYSQESTIEQAFKDTFGGERPCNMCKIISAVDSSGQETPLKTGESNKLTLMLGLAQSLHLNAPHSRLSEMPLAQLCWSNAPISVPTPPPRLV